MSAGEAEKHPSTDVSAMVQLFRKAAQITKMRGGVKLSGFVLLMNVCF